MSDNALYIRSGSGPHDLRDLSQEYLRRLPQNLRKETLFNILWLEARQLVLLICQLLPPIVKVTDPPTSRSANS